MRDLLTRSTYKLLQLEPRTSLGFHQETKDLMLLQKQTCSAW
jgi:hypothetical protein